MFRTATGWVVSPTDLVDQLECDHRSALKTALAAHVPGAPTPQDIDPLIAQHGLTHEHTELTRLNSLVEVAHIPTPTTDDTSLTEAAHATAQAMREGIPVIYQGSFHHHLPTTPTAPPVAFHGRADFLIRSDLDPTTGHLTHTTDHTYEPWDTKLARRPGPGAVVQLAAYAQALTHTTGRTPHHMHLLTGDNHTHTLPTAEFTPVLGTLTTRLLHLLAHEPTLPTPTWGRPRPACEGCGYAPWCAQGRTAARHLSLVAGLRTDQATKLTDAELTTIDALARADDDQRPATLPQRSFDQLRAQAALQVRQDATRTPHNPQGQVTAEVFAPDGLASLPTPSPGDVFFDMEGYPYHSHQGERGLEYLFGATTEDPDETFHAFWAHDRAQEKQALEDFVDFAMARIDADEDAHIYHYASYEADRLKHLSSVFATREEEVNRLLREQRLVDLYTVVRKSLRVSQRSYSIKYLEPLYLPTARTGDVTTAASSIDAYAAYLDAHQSHHTDTAQRVLADIAAYNRDDCHSTARLRDWLEHQRTLQAITERPVRQRELTETEAERARKRAEKAARHTALTDPLLDQVPTEPHQRDDDENTRATLASLVGYYQREALPPWREHYRRTAAPLTDLETDNDCAVPHRVHTGTWIEPTGRQRKARRELALHLDTARPHPFSTGDSVHLLYPGAPGQAATTNTATVTDAHPDHLQITETCDADATYSRPPVAVLPGAPVNAQPKDGALEQLAHTAVRELPTWPHTPGLDVVRRIRPRLNPPGPLPDPAESDLITTVLAATDRLDHSYLAVQGPPGAGKTYLAAQLITHLIKQGKSVGVCSTGHKAVENVMSAALRAAEHTDLHIAAAKRAKSRTTAPTEPPPPWDQPTTPQALATWRNQHTTQSRPVLIGGTAWAMSNATMIADPLDVLIIDEAGQFALADTLAVSAAAHNLVLLGDPRQLPQVVQGTHGQGADASALQHLMGDQHIIDPALGYFLDQTRRMHPAVCRPVSHLSYQGRLHAHPTTAQRTLSPLTPGLYTHPVTHTGRTTHSPEEIDHVVAVATHLVDQHLTFDPDHPPRPLTGTDILVVAPYNMQVRALRRALTTATHTTPALEGIRVGTVDKFQGQEAAAVICSMTASNAAEAGRGTAFVLDRNRLNVALSRAQLIAVIIHSTDLTTTTPRTIDELRLLASFTGLLQGAHPWPTPTPHRPQ